MSTWFITGGSTGSGRAFALEALQQGHQVRGDLDTWESVSRSADFA